MAIIKPFRALRPQPALAKDVAARPYDVLNSKEAAAEARLHGFLYEHPWVDMGTHTGLHYARELVSSQKA